MCAWLSAWCSTWLCLLSCQRERDTIGEREPGRHSEPQRILRSAEKARFFPVLLEVDFEYFTSCTTCNGFFGDSILGISLEQFFRWLVAYSSRTSHLAKHGFQSSFPFQLAGLAQELAHSGPVLGKLRGWGQVLTGTTSCANVAGVFHQLEASLTPTWNSNSSPVVDHCHT